MMKLVDTKGYIDKIKNGAIQGWLDNKILPSLTMAQGILESGWGTSKLAQPSYNNNFGIKYNKDEDAGKYKYDMFDTKEWDKSIGDYITIKAPFRVYDSLDASVLDHTKFFTSTPARVTRYAKVVGERDYVRACRAVRLAGYATDPLYDTKLINIINQYNLVQYDKEAFAKEGHTEGVGVLGKKHLVICGHGQGQNSYDPGAVNNNLGLKEAEENRKLADVMSKYSTNISYIKEKDVFNYGSLASDSVGYDTVTELHFNAFNGSANGTEILIHSEFDADEMDQRLLGVLSKYFKNRGFKKVNNIYNINVAYDNDINYRLVEVCFIDNDADMKLYQEKVEEIAKGLVEAIENKVINQPTFEEKKEASTANEGEYIVQKGDTLWRIAKLSGLSVSDLKLLNNLTDNIIKTGQVLKIKKGLDSSASQSTVTDSVTSVGGQLDKMLKWFEERVGKVTYSMENRQGPNSYDCSSAVYSALKYAGFKTRISYLGNTETLFKEKGYLFKEISRNEIKRGDIFVSGVEGQSLGSYGHTGVVYSSNQIIHCTYPANGIAITPITNWTGSPTRWFRIVGANEDKHTEAKTTTSDNKVVYNGNEMVKLPADVDSWRVYSVSGPYKVGSEIGELLPSKFGGLDYDVLGWLEPNVAKIKTASYGEVAIYVGRETGAVVVKKTELPKIVDSPNIAKENSKTTDYTVDIQPIKEGKGTITHFADKYESGGKIPDSVKGRTYTIVGNHKVNKGKSRISYMLKELKEWVLEEDLYEAYGLAKVDFDPNGAVYPLSFGKLGLGQEVTIREKAETYLNKVAIPSDVKGKKYRIIDIVQLEVSYSRYGYKLAGLNEIVLEQDIIEAWSEAKPSINREEVKEEVKDDIVEFWGVVDGQWQEIKPINGEWKLESKSITVGSLVINGVYQPISYTVDGVEFTSQTVFGSHKGIESIKFSLPKGYEFCVRVPSIGKTSWVNYTYSGSKAEKITGLYLRKV